METILNGRPHYPTGESKAENAPIAFADTVLYNLPVGDDYWHLGLSAHSAHLTARPGQFFHIRCPSTSVGDPYLRRPMSVYATDPEAGTVEFLYKVTGIGTYGLSTLTPHEELDILGPLGNGFHVTPEWSHAVVVARGVGLATMGPLAGQLATEDVHITALCSYREAGAVIGLEPFSKAGADIHSVYDTDGSSGMAEVAERIRRLHRGRPIDVVFTCGSNRIARMLQALQVELNIAGQIALEQRMGCAIGMCHACVLDFKGPNGVESRRVCCQGPVFALEELL